LWTPVLILRLSFKAHAPLLWLLSACFKATILRRLVSCGLSPLFLEAEEAEVSEVKEGCPEVGGKWMGGWEILLLSLSLLMCILAISQITWC
jgi:hypothetical protein